LSKSFPVFATLNRLANVLCLTNAKRGKATARWCQQPKTVEQIKEFLENLKHAA
jgi:hypothetical protein